MSNPSSAHQIKLPLLWDFLFVIIQNMNIPKLDTSITDQMLKRAEDTLSRTYPTPFQGYAVCLYTKAGNFYDGASYNSDTQSLTMHSEASALANAALHGETDIVAITGPNCHICKQLIWESSLRSGIDTLIVLREDNQTKLIPISELMPYPWPDKNGEK